MGSITTVIPDIGTGEEQEQQLEAVTRRFLQARRRGPFDLRELTRLLHPDATYTEFIDDDTHWIVRGPAAIAQVLQELWNRRGDTESMEIVRHAVTGDDTAVGHWRRRHRDGRVSYGRDSYRVRDGLLLSIEVEHFEEAAIPRPLLAV